MLMLILLILGVLIASGICSMMEAAILSLPLIKARMLEENKRRGSLDLLLIKENVHSAVATIVILNNGVNIIGSIFVGQMVTRMFGGQWLGMASAVFTFFIITISEVIPKTIGEQYKVPISLKSAKTLRILTLIFKPVVAVVAFFTNRFRRSSQLPKVTEEEIKMMLKIGTKDGTVEVDEEVMCNRIFKLNDFKAHQMMKPIGKVYALPADQTLLEAKQAICDSPYSRIVIFDQDISHIVGVCQQRKLLKELSLDDYTGTLKDFMARPIFVDENERADRLLEKFQAYHQHLFIVKDAKGRNTGIIAMEDVLEELFGEIYDEREAKKQESK
ncbi:hemolysin family protein [Candidatus Omnitrophota bacterium]